MNTPYRTVPIPRFEHATVPNGLEAMTNSSLPGFVVQLEATLLDADGKPDVPALYGSVLEQQGFAITEYQVLREDQPNQGFPLHFDYEPQPDSRIVDKVNFHFTQTGTAEVSLLEPKDRFWNEEFYDVTEDQDSDFEKGLIDDDYFHPLRYATELRPSTLLVFRLQGVVPLVHKFKTRQLDRTSHIWMAERQRNLLRAPAPLLNID